MIPFLDLRAINAAYRVELIDACTRVVDSGWYVGGNELSQFESAFARYCGSSHCIGVANGLDALILTLRAWKELGRLKEGDEVIIPAYTYAATALAVIHAGAKPVIVDINDDFNISVAEIAKAITPKTKAIILSKFYFHFTCTRFLLNFLKVQKSLEKRYLRTLHPPLPSHT